MNTANRKKPLLITIALSHYCEKARWAMDYSNLNYQEESHTPLFHRQYTSRYGGTTVPVLVTENKALTDSHDILEYLNDISEDKKLYPENLQLCDRVKTLEKLFDEKLGVATRVWGYYYAMEEPLKVALAWGIKAPLTEKIKTIVSSHNIPRLLKISYRINLQTKNTALKNIKEVFATVNDELNSGEQYLVGDRLSAADITFAALASPILHPPNHPIYSSELSKMSDERLAVIKELRSTPAGKLAMHIYREHRS